MISGIVFLDKPLGWSSRRAVNEVMRIFGGKRAGVKAGHTGTLDPLATGMLPIPLGEATRFAAMGLDADKCYEVTIDLSYQTDTLDCEGEVTARFDAFPDAEAVRENVEGFLGEQQQVPPIYSAIKVDGKRAHKLARSGEVPELNARTVTIEEIEILENAPPMLSLRVSCSKGTYIRSLARDIGESLGVGGCVVALRRLSTGSWPAEKMVTIEELAELRERAVMPLAEWLAFLPRIDLAADLAARFLLGQRLVVAAPGFSGLCTLFNGDILLGTGEIEYSGGDSALLRPKRVLPSAQQRSDT